MHDILAHDPSVLEIYAPGGPAIKFMRLDHGVGMPLPAYATEGAAGMDICANDLYLVETRDIVTVTTGLAIELPPGFEAQVRSRSGLAKEGLVVANSPGTIDSDYRGEIKVLITNIGRRARMIRPGERIAQLVIARVEQLPILEVCNLSATARGANGFGSTGR